MTTLKEYQSIYWHCMRCGSDFSRVHPSCPYCTATSVEVPRIIPPSMVVPEPQPVPDNLDLVPDPPPDTGAEDPQDADTPQEGDELDGTPKDLTEGGPPPQPRPRPNWEQMNKPKLQAELDALGIPRRGTKDLLIRKLIAHFEGKPIPTR